MMYAIFGEKMIQYHFASMKGYEIESTKCNFAKARILIHISIAYYKKNLESDITNHV